MGVKRALNEPLKQCAVHSSKNLFLNLMAQDFRLLNLKSKTKRFSLVVAHQGSNGPRRANGNAIKVTHSATITLWKMKGQDWHACLNECAQASGVLQSTIFHFPMCGY